MNCKSCLTVSAGYALSAACHKKHLIADQQPMHLCKATGVHGQLHQAIAMEGPPLQQQLPHKVPCSKQDGSTELHRSLTQVFSTDVNLRRR